MHNHIHITGTTYHQNITCKNQETRHAQMARFGRNSYKLQQQSLATCFITSIMFMCPTVKPGTTTLTQALKITLKH